MAADEEDPRYSRPWSEISSQEWNEFFTTDGVALRDHGATNPTTPRATLPPAPYHAVDITELPTAGPATPFQPGPNAPVVRPTLPPVEHLDVGMAYRRFSWPPVADPPAEITHLIPTVRELSPILQDNAPVAPVPVVPFPEEWTHWPDGVVGHVKHTLGALFDGTVRRMTPAPQRPSTGGPSNPHEVVSLSARARAVSRAYIDGPHADEDARAIQAEIAEHFWRCELDALRTYFHGPHDPRQDHCRFCPKESGAMRCRRADLPHFALNWLCFPCQVAIMRSHETEVARGKCSMQTAIEVDLRSRLTVRTDRPPTTYEQFQAQQFQAQQAPPAFARPAPPTRPRW